MTDLATLILEVDSSAVPKATGALDKLTASGTRAEAITADLGRTTNTAAAQATRMAAEAQRMAHGLGSFGSSANNARIVGLEMAHVTRSLGEQLAMGVSPARAFASEIGRISTAAQYAGGISGLASAIGGMIAPFAGAAAAAGLLAAALLGVKQSAADDAEMQRFIGTLGLTKKEIEKLKDTTVTWGDVTKATFQVLAEKAGTSSAQISGFFSNAFRSIGEFGKFSAAIILAAFGASVKGVGDVVLRLPDVIGGAMVAAANLAIAALEKMVNLGIAGINKLADGVNSILGTSLGHIADVSLGRVGKEFVTLSDTAKAVGADVSATFYGIYNRTQATFDAISARATKLREDSIRNQAEDLIADRTNKAAAAHRNRAKAASDEADALKKLHDRLQELLAQPALLDKDLLNIKPVTRLDAPDVEDIFKRLPSVEVKLNPLQEWLASIPHTADQAVNALQQIQVRGLDGIATAITDVVTGTKSFKQAFSDLARSVLSEIIQMTVRMLIFRAISGAIGGGGAVTPNPNAGGLTVPGAFAMGGVFAHGNVIPFASGGVVGGPTLFPMSGNRTGLMGEAGEEAVMPLARDSSGRLGVRAANSNEPQHVIVEVRLDSGMLQAEIIQGAGQVFIAGAPGLVKAATKNTLRVSQRRPLSGGR